ncbi:hypothetical protein Y032_0015g2827 [Ancylostoma ceylanicum]|uniref:Uncharacterized protein n=1 Tax=Ancylostoma ceylanicum TaxID=53326 RepID=A0A016V7Y5_9BILA|nr:hypothetical protein Y032_0015g2827 [Ancylostoma ceylanicum]
MSQFPQFARVQWLANQERAHRLERPPGKPRLTDGPVAWACVGMRDVSLPRTHSTTEMEALNYQPYHYN